MARLEESFSPHRVIGTYREQRGLASALLTASRWPASHGGAYVPFVPILAKLATPNSGIREDPDGKDATYGFDRLIDFARAEPVAVTKHGRRVVVMAVGEYERLTASAKQG
jgi:hypothetical protein